MAYKIIEMPRFQTGYSYALDYLTYTLGSPQAANHLMDEMDKAISIIEVDPYIKALSMKDILEGLDIREYLVMNYVVLYRVYEELGVVEFLDFYHQMQDYERFFK